MEGQQIHALDSHLEKFKPIGLDQLAESNLQNRMDTKFLVSNNLLLDFLPELENYYTVMTIDDQRVFTYRSNYFDTSNLDLFHRHLRGFKNRHKVRIRNYVESDLHFFEVKLKRKGRTIKSRIPVKAFKAEIGGHMEDFYGDQLGDKALDLSHSLHSEYKRITLVAKDLSERVTIDTHLSFSKNGSAISLPDQGIIELKQEGINRNSVAYDFLKSRLVRPSSLSKYCVGTALLNPDIKQNKLKKIIRNISYQHLNK